MNAPKVYISIPMAGQPREGLELARMAEDVVRAMGGIPVVPHDIPPYDHEGPCPRGYATSNGHSSACFLRSDLIEMLRCDYVLFGPGWERSVGCSQGEMSTAALCGMEILFFDAESGEIRDSRHNYLLSF